MNLCDSTLVQPVAGISRAMVMAAGLGKRMRPLTDTIPKPLIRLCDKTLIDHALDRLVLAGVETAVVNVHYMAAPLERHLALRTRPEIVVSDERTQLLDTGGGAAKMLDVLGPGAFFAVNCDSVWIDGVADSLRRLAAGWDDARMDCLILCAPTVNSIGYAGTGDFVMDEAGGLTRRDEGQVAPFVNTGAYVVHPRLFTDLPGPVFSMNLLWDRAIAAGRLYGIRHDGIWMHVGSPAALADAEARMSELAV